MADLWLASVQWTLSTVFNPKGWLLSKVDLAVAFLYWTIYFIFDQEIDGCERAKKGIDYYLKLRELLRMRKETQKVYNLSL